MLNKKALSLVLVCLLLISLFAGCGKTEPSAPTQNGPADAPNQAGSPAVTPAEDDDFSIKLKWVSFRPATHVSVIAIQETFVKRIYEATEGRVEIEYLGGTEIIAAADLGLAIKNGTFDFADLYVGAYDSVVPGAGCLSLSQLSPEEERSSGAYDVIDALHQENGIKYLGRPEGQPGGYFYLFGKGPAPLTKEDFGKMSIGTAAGAKDAVAGWGAEPVTVTVADNYEALQNNIVPAIAGQPMSGSISNGWYELLDWAIDAPFYQSTTLMIMSLETWNKIPAKYQDIIMDVVAEVEAEVYASRIEQEAAYRATLEESGVEFIKLDEETEAWYLEQAYENAWAVQEAVHPDIVPELHELLSSK